MSSESYGKYISEVYDTLNSDIDYEKWADFTEECFKKYCTLGVKHINEIACGTGSMSVLLAKRGYNLTCSDLSVEMLSLADKKARDFNLSNIVFTNQDMRCFSDSVKAQAVLCMLDSINCLKTPKEVKACISCANRVLEMGGIFLFDINSKYKFENVYADNAYVLEDEGILCAWQNFYNENSKLCDFYLSFFIEQADGSYKRHDEELREKMYTEKCVKKYLSECGFDICGVFSDYDFSPADENKHERLYFAAVKNQDISENEYI